MLVVGLIGVALTLAGALTKDTTCEKIAEAITRDYES